MSENFENNLVLIIGDASVYLYHIRSDKLITLMEAHWKSEEKIVKLREYIIMQNSSVKIIIDVFHQYLERKNIIGPNIKYLKESADQIFSKFSKGDYIYGILPSIFLKNKHEIEREYIFYSCPYSEYLHFWANFIFELPNPVTEILSLPFEFYYFFQKKILSYYLPNYDVDRNHAYSTWYLFIFKTRSSKYRIITTKDNNFYSSNHLDVNDIIDDYSSAVSLERCINAEIHNIQRAPLDKLYLFIITSKNIKRHLINLGFNLYSPFFIDVEELFTKLSVDGHLNDNGDSFLDELFVINSVKEKSFFPLKDKLFDSQIKLEKIILIWRNLFFIFPIILYSILHLFWVNIDLNHQEETLLNDLKTATYYKSEFLNQVEKMQADPVLKKTNYIRNMIAIKDTSLNDIFTILKDTQHPNIIINNLEVLDISYDVSKQKFYKIALSVDIIALDVNINEAMGVMKVYIKSIQNLLPQYRIQSSRNNIPISSISSTVIPVTIYIYGPVQMPGVIE